MRLEEVENPCDEALNSSMTACGNSGHPVELLLSPVFHLPATITPPPPGLERIWIVFPRQRQDAPDACLQSAAALSAANWPVGAVLTLGPDNWADLPALIQQAIQKLPQLWELRMMPAAAEAGQSSLPAEKMQPALHAAMMKVRQAAAGWPCAVRGERLPLCGAEEADWGFLAHSREEETAFFLPPDSGNWERRPERPHCPAAEKCAYAGYEQCAGGPLPPFWQPAPFLETPRSPEPFPWLRNEEEILYLSRYTDVFFQEKALLLKNRLFGTGIALPLRGAAQRVFLHRLERGLSPQDLCVFLQKQGLSEEWLNDMLRECVCS